MTQELVKELFEYKEDGHFYWKKPTTNSIKLGQIAGSICFKGYRQIKINGKFYKEHRLAWFYHYGVFPINQIDHINNIKTDNRINNLREATNAQNQGNKVKRKGTSSKFKGCSWSKKHQKWRVRITINKKTKHLGCFHEESAAAQAYNEAAIKHFGEFALINQI